MLSQNESLKVSGAAPRAVALSPLEQRVEEAEHLLHDSVLSQVVLSCKQGTVYPIIINLYSKSHFVEHAGCSVGVKKLLLSSKNRPQNVPLPTSSMFPMIQFVQA